MHHIDYTFQQMTYDRFNQYAILKSFPEQLRKGLEFANNSDFGKLDLISTRNVIICGMGGSAIGGDILRNYVTRSSRVPFAVNRTYSLPNYADEKTLVIVMSYSGNTDETLSAYEDAKTKKAQILAITSGGELLKRAQKDGIPKVEIPGGLAPRAALGYLFFSLLGACRKIGLLSLGDKELSSAIEETQKKVELYSSLTGADNPAKTMAERLHGRLPVIYCSQDNLESVSVRWRCQIEENAKMLSYSNVFPELNHNEIVGWEQNEDLLKRVALIVLRDESDLPQISRRIDVTVELIKPYAGDIIEVSTEGSILLSRILGLICLGDWISFYLAIGANVDPYPIEKIDALKSALTEIR